MLDTRVMWFTARLCAFDPVRDTLQSGGATRTVATLISNGGVRHLNMEA